MRRRARSPKRRWSLAALATTTLALLLAGGGSAHPLDAATAPRALTAGLPNAQLAGQRVILSYDGLTPPRGVLQAIRAGRAAGVIFFGSNIASRSQLRGVAAELQRAAAQSPVKLPLLLMTDQEGGLIRRLPGAPALSEKQIGAAADPASAARRAGRGAALNLRGVGLNVNLAPVLDVYRRPGDFDDQFQRSYSGNPRTAASLGAAFIGSQQLAGVAATAKHFPGLGAATASQNTDEEPVRLNLSLRTLRGVDELPYRSAVAAGARLVMVSWATYPALDPRRPAGLSAAVVQGELRGRLRFSGVTITDALEAGALRAYGTTGNRAVLAAGAGMDLILCSARSPSQGSAATGALAAALGRGTLNRPAFLAAVNRVIALRRAMAGSPR